MPSALLRSSPAAKYNERITVQCLKAAVPDASGHVVQSDPTNWITFYPCWANIVPAGSREFFRGQQVAADITHQVTIRFCQKAALVATDMRILFKSRVFSISGPPRNLNEQNSEIVFACIEAKEGR